ncbi:MAG: hypothetical protein COV44_09055 [Deltaproteobacteria bacterium CG11_big_fil_rev_8_21_14_0_20_45_16]|nr:MAG: hypothetical protein COV44_09055 [Deltaproteobacteria bacterium CG11_big_fil_rev_8_21_14_0_20_45_16]
MFRVWAVSFVFGSVILILFSTSICLADIGDRQDPIRITPGNSEPIGLEPQASGAPLNKTVSVDDAIGQRQARVGYYVEQKDFASLFLEQLKALARAGNSKYFLVVAVDGIKGRFIVWNSIVVFRPGEFGLGLDRFEGRAYLGVQAGNLNRLRGILKKLKFRDGPKINGMVLKVGVMANPEGFQAAVKTADALGRFLPVRNTLLIKGTATSVADTVLAHRIEGGSIREDVWGEFFQAKSLSLMGILGRVGIAAGAIGGCLVTFQALF